MLLNGREKVGIGNLKNPKAFTDYSQITDDVYENLEHYNPTKKWRVLIVFDNMIADMETIKKLSPIVTGWFIRGRKLNISLVFISQPYFIVPKTITLNVTHYFIMNIPNKRELEQIASNHLSDIAIYEELIIKMSKVKYKTKLLKLYKQKLFGNLFHHQC